MSLVDAPDRPLRSGAEARCELYRALAEPVRARLLGLASREELSVGELSELLRELQPKVSRHAAALREAGVLDARRQGTFTLLRLSPRAARDPVVADAVAAGLAACDADGTLAKVDEIVARRDAQTREFFARSGRPLAAGPPSELAAYLALVAPLLPRRAVAVDVGTGDGALLEVLAPLFEQVVALDRSEAQLALAEKRVERRGFANVTLVHAEIDGAEAKAAVREAARRARSPRPLADAVFAARVLHHAAVPQRALRAITELASPPRGDEPGGAVCVLDYAEHDDESLRAREADLWLGFDRDALLEAARAAGLAGAAVREIPPAWQGDGPDRHLGWQLLVGSRAEARELPSPPRATSHGRRVTPRTKRKNHG